MLYELTDKIRLYHGDCMEFMAGCKDKEFDLAIVDPPYRDENQPTKSMRQYSGGNMKTFGSKPNKNYFDLLESISFNRIVWGGNNFFDLLGNTNCFIFWYKRNPMSNYSDGELAWTSFQSVAKYFDYVYHGNHSGNTIVSNKIHPTQKPVALYKWLLTNYAKPGQSIFDSHGGSMSIGIAAYDLGFDITICEKDDDYFFAAKARLEEHIAKYAPASDIATTKQGQVKLF